MELSEFVIDITGKLVHSNPSCPDEISGITELTVLSIFNKNRIPLLLFI
jgi:hypothetical protein